MLLALVAVVWVVVSAAAALLIGGAIRGADRRAPLTDDLVALPAELTVAHVLGNHVVQPSR